MEFNTSDLILNTSDYSFSHFEHEGLGGATKYIAISKNGTIPKKLLVKHNCEYAATSNGFVFGRIAELLGITVPKTFMFDISDEDKYLFESPCVMGMEYIEGLQPFDMTLIKSNPKYLKAYVEYHVLFALLTGFEDKTQISYLPDDNIYPIDFDESFRFEKGSFNVLFENNYYSNYEISRMLKNLQSNGISRNLRVCHSVLCDQLGYDEKKEKVPYFYDFLERFCELTEEEICSVTEALFELFPELIGLYYDEYIVMVQKLTREYLNQTNKK